MKRNFFGEFYAYTLPDYLNDIYNSVSENSSSAEYSSDSHDVNDQQKTLVIDSDTESNNEIHGAGGRSFASTEQWTEDDIEN